MSGYPLNFAQRYDSGETRFQFRFSLPCNFSLFQFTVCFFSRKGTTREKGGLGNCGTSMEIDANKDNYLQISCRKKGRKAMFYGVLLFQEDSPIDDKRILNYSLSGRNRSSNIICCTTSLAYSLGCKP